MSSDRAAVIVMPGEGETFDVAGDRYRMLATTGGTAGRYAIWEAIVPPGGGPPPHRHTREEEGFYVLEGEVAIYAGGRRVVGTAGTFVNMPVDSAHWFRNESDQPARLLILAAPAGMERMFRELSRPVPDPSAPIPPLDETGVRKILAIAPKYGIEMIEGEHVHH